MMGDEFGEERHLLLGTTAGKDHIPSQRAEDRRVSDKPQESLVKPQEKVL